MADPEQETQLLDGTVSHSISESTGIVDNTNEQTDNDGMSEELLSQALADAHAFDTSTITYTVNSEESETCDTVHHDHACVSEGLTLGVDYNGQEHISTDVETILVHSSESILTNRSDAIFSTGTHSLLTNGTSETLGVESNETFTVDIGSLPDNHIISVRNDILPGSVVVSQESEHYQQPVEGDETHLLQDETHQIVHEMETDYIQHTDTQILQSDSDSHLIQSDAFSQPRTITVSAASGMTLTPEVLQSVIQQIQAQQIAQQQAADPSKHSPNEVVATSQNTVSFTLVSPSQCNSNSPPLGSSQNPIRIIQQGNRYTPMQQLTPEQLQQIMQVVQQQHVNKNTQENGGAVIFNPQTNTRIMYRVIYPSELHKTQNGAGHTTYQVVRPSTSSQEQQTGTAQQKRPYRKRKDIAIASGVTGEEEDKEKSAPDAPELSKEEKEERKKHRPRTRSGRVSKPPKHMVQDYKRIHVLDWDEDYDDSDGGYSDFKHSDEEAKVKQEGEEEHSTSPEFFQALGAGRPKNHKCQTCDKSYIGQAGLARHYRLNQDHCINPTENDSISSLHNGSIDGDDSKDASLLPDGSSSRMSDSAVDVSKAICNTSSIENISEDSNTQDSLNSTGATSPVVRRGRGRGGFRGRWAHLKHNAQIRRKNKLKELIKQCSDEDLMEVVLPRLVSSVSLWEYLMMKSENGGSRPQVDIIYREFESLTHHVRKACTDYMQPLTWEELEDDNLQCKMIKVSDKNLAVFLNMEPVTYKVKVMPAGDSNSFSSLHNRLSSATLTPSLDIAASSLTKHLTVRKGNAELLSDVSVKRPVDYDDTEQSATKRVKTSSMSSTFNHIQTSSATPATLASTYTVTASLPLSMESKVTCARSLSPLSSSLSTSVTSPQSALLRGQSLPVTSSLSSSASQSISLSSKYNSTSASVRSPYIHISCPTTKQPVSHSLAGPKKLSPASSRPNKIQNQPVPVVITQSTGGPGSKTQVLPFIMDGTSASLAGLQQKVIVTASESQILQTSSVPVLFSATGTQQAGNATMLLASTSSSAVTGNKVIVRHPTQTVHQVPANVILTNQSSPLKSQKGGVSVHSFFPMASVTTIQTPTLPSNSRSLLGIMKPTEVRVSRQLFHETTSPSMSSSAFTNGRSTVKTSVNSLDSSLQHLHAIPTMVSSCSHPVITTASAVICNTLEVPVKSGGNKTLVTPPSGQQFATSPNKTARGSQMTGVDDISVLSTMDLSTDDLGPLNTSSDSLNGSLTGCTHMTDQLITGTAATSNASQNTDDTTSLVDMVQIVNTDTQTYGNITKSSLCNPHNIPLVNGNSSSYMKAKHDNIVSQTSLSSLSSPFALSEHQDFIHISPKPHPKLISNISQDSSSIIQSTSSYHIATNGLLNNHDLKPDITSSITMADISSLPFTDQGTTHIVDGDHLSGISSILTSEELQETTINILSEQLSGSETQETDCQGVDLNEATVSDSLIGEEDGQLLLSEGTNIYQTEDGTLIIQRANGNTYQLQGAQGLSLETVQALLSGTLDQLVGGDASGDGIQTDLH